MSCSKLVSTWRLTVLSLPPLVRLPCLRALKFVDICGKDEKIQKVVENGKNMHKYNI